MHHTQDQSYTNVEWLLTNESFIGWALHGEDTHRDFWEQTMKRSAAHRQAIMEAQMALLQLRFNKNTLQPGDKSSLFAQIEQRTTGRAMANVYQELQNHMENMGYLGGAGTEAIRPLKSSSRAIKRGPGIGFYRVAAVILFVLSFSVIAYYEVGHRGADIAQPMKAFVKQSPKGQKLITYLPDGTKVILNSESNISYTYRADLKTRHVTLQGEAFFEVVRDTTCQFVVESYGVRTTALGTSFSVASSTDGKVDVALATGIVQVQTQKAAPVQLLPGEAVRVASNGSTEVYNFNYLGQMGWKDGILVFKENTLPEIINKLESWYGVDIINTISAQEKFRYTGTNQNESLDEVLKGISFVHHFQYTIDGDTVRLYP